jgi:excisionase family DNA binding protein
MTVKKQAAVEVEPILYSMEQTAQRLNVSRTLIYSEIAKGELQTTQIGDRRFTTNEQQRAYIARKQRQTARAS